MSSKKPVFVCVPGAWHGGWAYDLVAAELSSAGYRCVATDLPGSRAVDDTRPPQDSMTPDVDAGNSPRTPLETPTNVLMRGG